MLLQDPSTVDRAAINRANAQKSTGPRTAAGKQRSSLNALRHGLTSQTAVLPNENHAIYLAFTKSFHDDLVPVGTLETHLAQSIADDVWRLNRATALETNLFALGLEEHAGSPVTGDPAVSEALAVAESMRRHMQELNTLSLHQNRISRAIDRNLKQLRVLQAERRARQNRQMAVGGQLHQLYRAAGSTQEIAQADPAPGDAPAPGFVFENVESDSAGSNHALAYRGQG